MADSDHFKPVHATQHMFLTHQAPKYGKLSDMEQNIRSEFPGSTFSCDRTKHGTKLGSYDTCHRSSSHLGHVMLLEATHERAQGKSSLGYTS